MLGIVVRAARVRRPGPYWSAPGTSRWPGTLESRPLWRSFIWRRPMLRGQMIWPLGWMTRWRARTIWCLLLARQEGSVAAARARAAATVEERRTRLAATAAALRGAAGIPPHRLVEVTRYTDLVERFTAATLTGWPSPDDSLLTSARPGPRRRPFPGLPCRRSAPQQAWTGQWPRSGTCPSVWRLRDDQNGPPVRVPPRSTAVLRWPRDALPAALTPATHQLRDHLQSRIDMDGAAFVRPWPFRPPATCARAVYDALVPPMTRGCGTLPGTAVIQGWSAPAFRPEMVESLAPDAC